MKRHMEVLALIVIVFIISAQVSQASSLPMSTAEINQDFGEVVPPIRTLNTKFEVQEPNKTWLKINGDYEDRPAQNVLNESLARFKGSFYNEGDLSVVLKSFVMRMIITFSNKTSYIVTDHTYEYSSEPSQTLRIAPYSSKTQSLESIISMPDSDQSYIFQIGFNYLDPNNASLTKFAISAFNFTLNIRIPFNNPPELIVIAFYIVTLLILFQIGIGYYGNRQKTVEKKKPKYSQ